FGGGGKMPFIIAPSFVKIPHVEIAAMMLDLLNIALEVRNFVIIGCGMRREDNFLWLLLTRFLNCSLKSRRRLIILDPSAALTWKRISDYWIGDICGFADVCIIPCRLEMSISTLQSALRNRPGQELW
ncbi:MAG: hypothetical protein NTV49_05305, partial [Kiritimatiellaeota bacterium]|nr:hypothetical protein [Kiritimatiellota bacterium]